MGLVLFKKVVCSQQLVFLEKKILKYISKLNAQNLVEHTKTKAIIILKELGKITSVTSGKRRLIEHKIRGERLFIKNTRFCKI